MTHTRSNSSPGPSLSHSAVNIESLDICSASASAAANERRDEQRHITIYRPCCVETGSGGCCIGIIRNISDNGAQIETPCHTDIGSQITYFWDGGPALTAEVVWMKDGRIGVRNIAAENRQVERHFPSRAIRVPTDLPATLWQGLNRCSVRVCNISQKGVKVSGISPMMDNALITVELGGLSFPQSSIRWKEGRHAGIGFDKPVPVKVLMELLADDIAIERAG